MYRSRSRTPPPPRETHPAPRQPPPPARPATATGAEGAVFADDETLPSHLARVNDEFVRAMRQASPRVMLDQLAALGEKLDELWTGVDLTAPPDLPVSWAGGGAAWLDIAREYTELWVHQQQIRDAVSRPGATEPALMHPVLDVFARALPHTVRHLDRPDGTVVALAATGPAGGRWCAVRDRGRWVMTTDGGGAAGEVVLAQDDLWRLASGGITVDEARRRATTTGDAELVAAVTSLLAVVA